MKKDKQKVLGETFSDERIRTFLDVEPYGAMNADFHRLEKAYRGMKADNFATFVQFFCEAGHDINATNSDGKTLLQLVRTHRLGDEYADILEKAGAH